MSEIEARRRGAIPGRRDEAPVTIAIIGLGTAGACMLESLAQALGARAKVALALYDPTSQPWRGRVYQPDDDSILANLVVTRMGLRAADPQHAERWLRANGHLQPDESTDTYLPRRVYGDYFVDHCEQLIGTLRAGGWTIRRVPHAATSLLPSDRGYLVGTEVGGEEFEHVVLCAGGGVYADPYGLGGYDDYVHSPYPTTTALDAIAPHATVGIVGSGLTAVDLALALQARGHRGPVRMYSRTGTLPLVRRSGPEWAPIQMTLPALRELASSQVGGRIGEVLRMFNREIADAGGDPLDVVPPPLDEDVEQALRRQLAGPHQPSDLAIFLFQRLIPIGWQDIWFSLGADRRQRILESPAAMRTIMSWCCPMPPVNAAKLLGLLESGRLSVSGGLRSIRRVTSGFEISVADRRDTAAVVVNAAAPTVFGVHPDVETLIDTAVAHGLVRRHHAGGIEVSADTSAALGDNGPGRLYALGDLTRGAFLLTHAIPALVSRSADIARAIAERGSPGSPGSASASSAEAPASHDEPKVPRPRSTAASDQTLSKRRRHTIG